MGKKIFGIVAIGLVFVLLIPVTSAYATYRSELTVVGVIRIDRTNSVIRGFIFFGDNDGQDLRFTFIKIKFDCTRTPMQVQTGMPIFVHHIYYNPAK